MKYVFISTLTKIINELGGSYFYPKPNPFYQLTISFRKENFEVFDHLKFMVTPEEIDCGVSLKSDLTNGKYVPLKIYVFQLIEYLEDEFCETISLPPTSARFYFKGEIEYKNYPINN